MQTVIYYTYIPQNLKINNLNEIAKSMPIKRYREFLKLDDEKSRLQNVVAYLLLEKVLKDNGFLTLDLTMEYSDDGKPYFKNLKCEFNISHSDNVVAVGISDDIIGIDVEKIQDININILDNVYSKLEQNDYQERLDDKEFFCKTWTIKESYTKALGKGLLINFTDLSFKLDEDFNRLENLFIKTYKIQDFYMSICSSKELITFDYCDLNLI